MKPRITTLQILAALVLACSAEDGPAARSDLDRETPARSIVFVAHRGGIVPGYPENTLAAFAQAIEHGAGVIEIDLRATRDGEIVVIHDETVNRTTDGRGRVDEMTSAELSALDAGNGQRIPTYEEVLEFVAGKDVDLLLDIKQGPGLDKREVVRVTYEHGAASNVIVGPRSVEDLREFSELDPDLRTLGFIADVNGIEPFIDAGVDIIRLWPEWIEADTGLVERVHRLGKPVWVTAGAAPREELERLVGLGVDGILSDSPALMRSLLADLRQR